MKIAFMEDKFRHIEDAMYRHNTYPASVGYGLLAVAWAIVFYTTHTEHYHD